MVNFDRGQKNIQYYTCPAGQVTIFICPANTHTCPLKAYAIKNIREKYDFPKYFFPKHSSYRMSALGRITRPF